MTAEGVAGRSHFQSLGCVSCHSGPRLTDSTLGSATLHDLGTLRTTSGQRLGGPLAGIDTPTLRGVWAGAPYFHDGSAESLEDVFSVAGGEVVPAESGAVSGGARLVDRFVDLNNDDTVRGRAYVSFDDGGGALTLSGVDGGPGGLGALELRYSTGFDRTFDVSVNGGAPMPLEVTSTGNEPWWAEVRWGRARLEDLPLVAGTSNTVDIVASGGGFFAVAVDEVVITSAAERSLATPHRSAATLTPAQQAELVAYLRQLDGTLEAAEAPPLFADDFESGDFTQWSGAAP